MGDGRAPVMAAGERLDGSVEGGRELKEVKMSLVERAVTGAVFVGFSRCDGSWV